MILPNLPSKFSGGEILTASKLNTLIDWMRDVARLLPSLQVSTGRGLSFSSGSAGTTISLAHGYVQGSGGEAEEPEGDEDASEASRRRLFRWSVDKVDADAAGRSCRSAIS